jgi:hypothetical protein
MINITTEIRNKVSTLYTKWLDQLAIRDRNEYGSARYNKAVDKADLIENEMSMLVFGDTAHTATESYEGKEAE